MTHWSCCRGWRHVLRACEYVLGSPDVPHDVKIYGVESCNTAPVCMLCHVSTAVSCDASCGACVGQSALWAFAVPWPLRGGASIWLQQGMFAFFVLAARPQLKRLLWSCCCRRQMLLCMALCNLAATTSGFQWFVVACGTGVSPACWFVACTVSLITPHSFVAHPGNTVLCCQMLLMLTSPHSMYIRAHLVC